jgi:CubicO group peptidase (beta-lactamase class C family)
MQELYGDVVRYERPPGVEFRYSNAGFALLGQLVTDVSGVALPEYLRANLFEPLGMSRSGFRRDDLDDVAGGYECRFDEIRAVPWQEIAVAGAGGALSCVLDLVQYLVAILRPQELAVAPGLFAEATAPQVVRPDGGWVGLGFMIRTLGAVRVLRHAGGWPGFASALWAAPDHDAGVVVLTNTSDAGVDPWAGRLLEELLDAVG